MARPTEDRLLYLLKSRGPQTAADAGSALGITAPGAQQQLARLAASGLVAGEDRRQRRGRPKRYYGLTEAGHARFPDRHSDLTLDLLKTTEAVFGLEGLDRLIRHREQAAFDSYQAALAGCRSTRERVERLAEIRSREGYMAEWREEAPGSYLLIENHCPICAAASFCQGLCRSELELFRSVLGPKARIERTDHIPSGARRCAYLVNEA